MHESFLGRILNRIPGEAKIGRSLVVTAAAAGEAGWLAWLRETTPLLREIPARQDTTAAIIGFLVAGWFGTMVAVRTARNRPRTEWVHTGLAVSTAVVAATIATLETRGFFRLAVAYPNLVENVLFRGSVIATGVGGMWWAGRNLWARHWERQNEAAAQMAQDQREQRRSAALLLGRRLKERHEEIAREDVMARLQLNSPLGDRGNEAVDLLAEMVLRGAPESEEVLQDVARAVNSGIKKLDHDLVVDLWTEARARREKKQRLLRP